MWESVSSAISAFNSAIDLLKKLQKKIEEKKDLELIQLIIDLQRLVITGIDEILTLKGQVLAQQMTISSLQSTILSLEQEKMKLERKLAELEEWNEYKKKCKLTEIAPNVLVAAVEEEVDGKKTVLYLCPTCLSRRKKSILKCIRYQNKLFVACPECSFYGSYGFTEEELMRLKAFLL